AVARNPEAPLDPNRRIIYAGTGEANFSLDSYYGRGILKSTDSGATWNLLTGNGVDGTPNNFDRRTISKIVTDPMNAAIVYVAVAVAGDNAVGGNTGIWKSENGGMTWTNTTRTISTTESFTDLVIDPLAPQTLYAAIGSVRGSAANGVYKTTTGGSMGW